MVDDVVAWFGVLIVFLGCFFMLWFTKIFYLWGACFVVGGLLIYYDVIKNEVKLRWCKNGLS